MLLCCRCQNELVFSVAYSGATLITLMWTAPHGLKMKIRSFCSWLRILIWPGLILHKPSRLVTYIHNLYLDKIQLSPRVWSPLIRSFTSNTKITVFLDFSPSPVRDHMPVSLPTTCSKYQNMFSHLKHYKVKRHWLAAFIDRPPICLISGHLFKYQTPTVKHIQDWSPSVTDHLFASCLLKSIFSVKELLLEFS